MIAPVRVSAWGPRFIGVRRAPLLIWVLGASAGAGDKMAIGVSRRMRPLILGRLSGAGPAATRLLELAAGSSTGRARNARPKVRELRRGGRGLGRRGCAGCGGSGGRACGPSTTTPAARRDGL